MKERLVQLLDLEQLTPSKFADIIGVQRSSVSHVISGRNNPSFDFIQKTLSAFPGLNAEWLILGKGTMYEQMGRQGPGTLFDSTANEEKKAPVTVEPRTERLQPATPEHEPEPFPGSVDREDVDAAGEVAQEKGDGKSSGNQANDQSTGSTGKKLSRIILLYDDDTFSSFEPS